MAELARQRPYVFGEMSHSEKVVWRNVLWRNVLTAKCPYGKMSHGDVSHGEKSHGEMSGHDSKHHLTKPNLSSYLKLTQLPYTLYIFTRLFISLYFSMFPVERWCNKCIQAPYYVSKKHKEKMPLVLKN